MSNQFKTKYHALAWAAEDEKNVFVDGEGNFVRIFIGIQRKNSLGVWSDVNSNFIYEPCHKLEPERSNFDIADEICTHDKDAMVRAFFDECDKRYMRKK